MPLRRPAAPDKGFSGGSPPAGLSSPAASSRARAEVTPTKAPNKAQPAADDNPGWAAKAELVGYYEQARVAPSTSALKAPASTFDNEHTVFGIPGERGMIATLVDIFTDHNIAELVLCMVHHADFVDAVESAFIDGLRTRGAPAAVLERAAGLARAVLRSDAADLVELLKAPGRCTESTRLAWCACRSRSCPLCVRASALLSKTARPSARSAPNHPRSNSRSPEITREFGRELSSSTLRSAFNRDQPMSVEITSLPYAPSLTNPSPDPRRDHCSLFDLHYLRLDLLLCIERRAEEWQVLPTRTCRPCACTLCNGKWSASRPWAQFSPCRHRPSAPRPPGTLLYSEHWLLAFPPCVRD